MANKNIKQEEVLELIEAAYAEGFKSGYNQEEVLVKPDEEGKEQAADYALTIKFK